MFRRIGGLLLAVLMSLTIAVPVYAQEQEVEAAAATGAALMSTSATVWLDGEQAAFDQAELYIYHGSTFAPAVELLALLDLQFDWDETNQLVIGSRAGWYVALQVGTGAAVINGTGVALPVAALVVGEELYVPLRFVSEAAGYTVGWNTATQTIVLTKIGLAESEGFLWRTEKDGAVVYLLGSIHVGDGSLYPLREEIMRAFAESDSLAVELDITRAGDPEIQELITRISRLERGKSLADMISPELYERVVVVLKENGVAGNAFDAYKPWVVSTIIESWASARAGYDGSRGIDQLFTTQAQRREMPIIELETYESQLSMMDSFSSELQERMLAESIDIYATGEMGITMLVAMWADGDSETLLQVTEQIGGNAELNQALLVDRNLGMTESIVAHLTSGEQSTLFVVVGAAHMLGESGIVTLLQEQGYTVEKQ